MKKILSEQMEMLDKFYEVLGISIALLLMYLIY